MWLILYGAESCTTHETDREKIDTFQTRGVPETNAENAMDGKNNKERT